MNADDLRAEVVLAGRRAVEGADRSNPRDFDWKFAKAAIRAVLEAVADELIDVAFVAGQAGKNQPDLAAAADHFRTLAGGAS